MILNFDSMEVTDIPNFKGGEGVVSAAMYVDGLNRIMRGRLPQGASIGMHTHDTSSEIIYVLSGEARIECDGQVERVRAGQSHYCPKGSSHATYNDLPEDLLIFAVVPQQ